MLRSLMLTSLLWLSGCGDEEASGDPTQVTYAEELGVNLEAMERRESGLYVQDVQPGTGDEAALGRQVTVHYTGWLPDGKQFGTSRGRSPFSFTPGAGGVIDGWEEGIVGMKVGGLRKLVIPSTLGYGERGQGDIPPDSVLIFDVELVSIP